MAHNCLTCQMSKNLSDGRVECHREAAQMVWFNLDEGEKPPFTGRIIETNKGQRLFVGVVWPPVDPFDYCAQYVHQM